MGIPCGNISETFIPRYMLNLKQVPGPHFHKISGENGF